MIWNNWPFLAAGTCLAVVIALLWLQRPRPTDDNEEIDSESAGGTDSSGPLRLTPKPGAIGFFAGVATGVIIATVVNWAAPESSPVAPPRTAPSAALPPSPATATIPESTSNLPPHQPPGPLSDEPPRISGLRASLEENPSNVNGRKELALFLLSEGRFVEAFEQAQTLLQASPNDPDGLYVQGVVRLQMGQAGRSIDLLQRLLVDYPNHVGALVTLGRAQRRAGLPEAATETWQRGLEAAGGRHLELEALLTEAGAALPEAAASNTFALLRGTHRDEAAQPDGYLVRVSLAPGATPPVGATLFLSARGPDGGPPLAARRVDDPVFPMQLLLGPQHSMTGQPLTATAQIQAKLDQDGNAFSVTPGDLSARQDGRLGGIVTLQLEN